MTSGAKQNKRPAATATKAVNAPDKAEVRAFLTENPHYLTENPDVLAAVVPGTRHTGKNVLDMQGFLIGRLKTENEKLNARHAELLATVRANVASQQRIHGAALLLLEARTFRELIEVVTTDLAMRLDVDIATLAVENAGGMTRNTVSGIRLLAPGDVSRLMDDERDVVLRSGIKGRKTLYGAGAGLVRSEALLRLHASPEAPTGILALASRDAERFDPGHGTELLGFLGRVLELCFRTWLGLPRS